MSIAKNTTQTFITKILGFIISFIGGVFLTRLLGPEGCGIISYIVTLAGFFSVLLSFNITNTLTYFIAKGNYKRSEVLGIGLSLIILGLVIFLFPILLSQIYENKFILKLFPEEYQSNLSILFLIASFLGMTFIRFFSGIMQGVKNFKIINLITLGSVILNLFVFSSLWGLHKTNIINVSIFNIFVVQIAIIICSLIIRILLISHYKIHFSFRLSKTLSIPIIKYASVGWATIVIGFLVKKMDIWIIQYYMSTKDLGYYSLATRLTDILILAFLPTINVILPYLAKKNNTKTQNLFFQFSRISITIIFIVCFILYFILDWAIPIIYGKEFIRAILPSKILCFGSLIIIIRNLVIIYNTSINKQDKNLKTIIVSFISILVLDFTLIPKFGIIGASWASILSYILGTIFILLISFENTKKALISMFILKKEDINLFINFIKTNKINF